MHTRRDVAGFVYQPIFGPAVVRLFLKESAGLSTGSAASRASSARRLQVAFNATICCRRRFSCATELALIARMKLVRVAECRMPADYAFDIYTASFPAAEKSPPQRCRQMGFARTLIKGHADYASPASSSMAQRRRIVGHARRRDY